MRESGEKQRGIARACAVSACEGRCTGLSADGYTGASAGERPRFDMAGYAIISLGGKQYRVQEGERLLVDRVKTDEGKTFHPEILFTGGDGKANLKPRVQVTAKVIGHVKGEKIRIGKYRRRTGYRRHTGYRSSLSEIEITAIGAKRSTTTTAKKTESKPKAASTAKKKAES